MKSHRVLPTICLLGIAYSQPASAQTFRIEAQGIESAVVAAIEADLAWAEARIDSLLGTLPEPITVRILPDRTTFTNALSAAWGIPETQCWMVGAADARRVFLLSPAVWGEQACEHDPADAEARRLLVTHEAVHAFHGQRNPSEDIGLLEDLGWFIEGLATFVSGQLESRHADRAAEAIRTDRAPARLSEAWSGPYRYGVTGSMIAYIDRTWGRKTLHELLGLTSQADLLARLATTEQEFLDGWRRWVIEGAPERRH